MSATRTEFAGNAVAYHASLADGWDLRYQKRSFQTRQTVLMRSLQGRRWLAERGCSVLGVDAAPEMVAAANQSAQRQNHSDRLSFVRITTIARLALDDRSLDGVLCSSVLEYVPDPSVCLTEFARVLKPGGLLLVSVPNRNSAVRRMLARAGFSGQKIVPFGGPLPGLAQRTRRWAPLLMFVTQKTA